MDKGLLLATQSGEVNLNIDQKTLEVCLKPISNFASTTYQNICTGQSYTVPTGLFDWFLFFVFIVPLAILLLLGLFVSLKEVFR